MTNPNFVSETNESRNKLNISSFQKPIHAQRNSISKHEELKGVSSRRRTTQFMRRKPEDFIPRRSRRETTLKFEQNSPNPHQHDSIVKGGPGRSQNFLENSIESEFSNNLSSFVNT